MNDMQQESDAIVETDLPLAGGFRNQSLPLRITGWLLMLLVALPLLLWFAGSAVYYLLELF